MDKSSNFLIPKQKKLTPEEVTSVLEKHNVDSISKLPKIKVKDKGIADLEVELGDVIEIERESFAGKTKYYRVVVE